MATDLRVDVKTVNKCCARFLAEGGAGLRDRSSPHRLRQLTPDAIVEQSAGLHRQRWTGDQIAQKVGVSPATVGRLDGWRPGSSPGMSGKRTSLSASMR